MDFCRNISVSGGLPTEYQPEEVLSPTCSKLGSLDDLFSGHVTEGDVNLEWLSVFVEDCLSSTGNCLPPAILTPNLETTNKNSDTTIPNPSKPLEVVKTQKDPSPPHTFVIAGKARRSKRKRGPLSWSHHFNPIDQTLQTTNSVSDPLLLHQAYWLADSELIFFPQKEQSRGEIEETRERNDEHEGINDEEKSSGSVEGSNGQQPRRCTHCLAQRTPQWRAGPLGPKTLCNACGVRYKSGRLLPEYRPAKSPTFVSYKHSNSHKKVMEMRMSLLPYHSS